MTNLIDRNPAGRDADEGSSQEVSAPDVQNLLTELISQIKRLRLALVDQGAAADIGDYDALLEEK